MRRRHGSRRRMVAALAAVVLATASTCSASTDAGDPPATSPVPPSPTGPPPGNEVCDRYGAARVQDGRYRVQNNVWGATTRQCIAVDDDGFAITVADHDNPTDDEPAAYPSIHIGCHHGNCTADSDLPRQVSAIRSVRSSVAITDVDAGEWNAAYDLWLDPTPRTHGRNTGAEIMIWIDHRGRPDAAGTRRGTATIAGATWAVWTRNPGWDVVAYVREEPTTSFTGDLMDFVDDAVGRGRVEPTWFLTSVQFGFEPWIGGRGLAVTSFSATVD